jgi:hypothetical protein
MAFAITITDSVDTMTIEFPSPPLSESIIEGATDVQTLDMNVYTDFFASKRLWSDVLPYMTETEFNQLKGFYDRQFSLWEYPTISIPDLNVTDVVVRMNLTPRMVIDNCGTVENVEVSFRETVQMTPEWGSS